MSQLIVIGDTHCQYDVIEAVIARQLEIDHTTSALLHVGDIGLYGPGSLARMSRHERELIEKHKNPIHLAYPYMEESPAGTTAGLPIICIPGNHEDFSIVESMERKDLAPRGLRLLAAGDRIEVPLGERTISVMGVGRIAPPPGSRHPRRVEYIRPEDLAIAGRVGEAAPPDVLLLHDPPAMSQAGRDHAFGTSLFTDLVVRIRPRVVLAGHMHLEYSTELDGIPVHGLGYGVKGRYAILDENLVLHRCDLDGRDPALRTATPFREKQPSREDRLRGRLRKTPLPITARQIIERFDLGRRQRQAVDACLAELRVVFLDQGGMSENQAWTLVEVSLRGQGLIGGGTL